MTDRSAGFVEPSLSGRVAIVTGGGWNVGRAVAEAFAAGGARVVVASRNVENLAATVARIRALGGTACSVPTDVTDPVAVERLVATARATYGEIDVMAALAGGGAVPGPVDTLTVEAWERVFRTNVTSAFLCARAVLPAFRRRDAGVLLFAAGGGAFHPVLGVEIAAYAAAKAAVCRLTDQLTAELWETGIRVNCIDPGLAWDEPTLAAIEADERAQGRPHPARPHHRPAAESGVLARWLASDLSAPLRGRCVSVYDTFWRDPLEVGRVDATVHLYRLRRADA